jgi:hypothetical protein
MFRTLHWFGPSLFVKRMKDKWVGIYKLIGIKERWYINVIFVGADVFLSKEESNLSLI